MRFRSTCIYTVLLAALALPAAAQDQKKIGDINFSGLIDGYYSFNFNHPATGFNTLRNFEIRSGQFSLNMAELSLWKDTDDDNQVGFRVDLGYGRAWDVFFATEPGTRNIQRYIPQAYVSLRPKGWGGFQIDFGKFYTSVGAELTENIYTWHYGRGYMYTNGPYYHYGARLTKPLTENFSVGFQLVNGWNNVEDNNTGKTMGFNAAYTTDKFSWLFNSYVGPEKTGTNKGWRGIYDTVINLTPNDWFTGYIDYYHGRENLANGPGTPAANWDAIGFSGKFNTSDTDFVAFRYEYFSDHDGFATGYGSQLNLHEFTATYSHTWEGGLEMRAEYRRDMSDQPFFEHGNQGMPLNPGFGAYIPGPYKHQDTLTLGFIMSF